MSQSHAGNTSNDPATLYQLGELYFESGDYPSAFKNFDAAADQGYADALFRLGSLYYKRHESLKYHPLFRSGMSFRYNAIAIKYLKEADKKGHEEATLTLGHCYYDNQKQADKKGREEAMLLSGHTYYDNQKHRRSMEEDNVKAAIKYYRKVADTGNVYAWGCLGDVYYYFGQFDEAKKWYEKSVEAGSDKGLIQLGDIYYYGKGDTRSNRDIGRDYFQQAAAKGNNKDVRTFFSDHGRPYVEISEISGFAEAKDDPEQLFQLGKKFIDSKQYDKGLICYERAGVRGHATALLCLGRMYAQGTGVYSVENTTSKIYLERAIGKGSQLAIAELGSYHLNKRDHETAIKYFEDAFRSPDAHTSINGASRLGFCYYRGLGVKENIEKALEYYEYSIQKSLDEKLGNDVREETVKKLEQVSGTNNFHADLVLLTAYELSGCKADADKVRATLLARSKLKKPSEDPWIAFRHYIDGLQCLGNNEMDKALAAFEKAKITGDVNLQVRVLITSATLRINCSQKEEKKEDREKAIDLALAEYNIAYGLATGLPMTRFRIITALQQFHDGNKSHTNCTRVLVDCCEQEAKIASAEGNTTRLNASYNMTKAYYEELANSSVLAIDDYVLCFRSLAPYASYIAINISSPNTPELRNLQHGELLQNLLTTLKKEQQLSFEVTKKYVPLVVKIAPDLTPDELTSLAEILLETKIDGIIATNTTLSREAIKDSPLAAEAGGLSGAPLNKPSTEIIRQLHALLQGKIPIIAAGGIFSAQDVKDKLAAGAVLVQVYTGFIYQGPWWINKLQYSA